MGKVEEVKAVKEEVEEEEGVVETEAAEEVEEGKADPSLCSG